MLNNKLYINQHQREERSAVVAHEHGGIDYENFVFLQIDTIIVREKELE